MIMKPLHLPSGLEELPANWQWSRLDEMCDAIYDCPHSTPMLTNDGPLVVRSQDIRSRVFRVHEAAHVSEETYRERVGRAEPRRGVEIVIWQARRSSQKGATMSDWVRTNLQEPFAKSERLEQAIRASMKGLGYAR